MEYSLTRASTWEEASMDLIARAHRFALEQGRIDAISLYADRGILEHLMEATKLSRGWAQRGLPEPTLHVCSWNVPSAGHSVRIDLSALNASPMGLRDTYWTQSYVVTLDEDHTGLTYDSRLALAAMLD